MTRIVHIITALNVGGAEMMLYKLLTRKTADVHAGVVVLQDIGPIGERIQACGIGVRPLGMRSRRLDAGAFVTLMRWLRDQKPDIVHTWMAHSNLFGGVAARLAVHAPIIWSVQHSRLDPRMTSRTTLWTDRGCTRLAPSVPSRIVFCSEAGRRIHTERGYPVEKTAVIPNGIDLTLFHSDPSAYASVREELGIHSGAALVGLIARFDPLKDHRTFIAAAGIIGRARPDVHFLLCGSRVDAGNQALRGWIRDAGLESACHLLGRRDDVPRITAALDVACLSSVSEGYPTVVGEAMACGVPCVVTDVGDSASIVGDTGMTVRSGDAVAFGDACLHVLALDADSRRELAIRARARVEAQCSLNAVVNRYHALYTEVLLQSRHRSKAGDTLDE